MSQSIEPTSKKLVDRFGRHISYLRVSVIDKCNLRCFYCMPKGYRDFETNSDYLNFDEIEQVIRVFASLGVGRVRLTGGEPLVRKNFSALAGRLSAIEGLDDLSVSTNAVLLEKHAEELKQAGVSRLNVSLDTLDEGRFERITGSNDLAAVLDGLKAAKRAGFSPIKINMVVMKGINDDEINDMVDYCLEHGYSLRFIETMPMGDIGRDASENYLDLTPVKQELQKRYGLVPGILPGGGPANYLRHPQTDLYIGFITPMSQHFCATCNRVRLSVNGTLFLCLGQEHSLELRPMLREGISDEALQQVLIKAMDLKPEAHEFSDKPDQSNRLMSFTGG